MDDVDDSAWWPLTWDTKLFDPVPLASVWIGAAVPYYIFDTRGRFTSGTSRYTHDFFITDDDINNRVDGDNTVMVHGDELVLRCALIELYRKLNPRR